MEVKIIEAYSRQEMPAQITQTTFIDFPKKQDQWNFSWRSLSKVEGGEIYKLTLKAEKPEIEGLIMLTLMNDEMLYMNTIEVAPHNYGSNGKYENVAGCLIAFGCLKSFELGKNHYEGYLTFESKTELIQFYQKKYGASIAAGQRMFINPKAGLNLIEKYLNRKL